MTDEAAAPSTNTQNHSQQGSDAVTAALSEDASALRAREGELPYRTTLQPPNDAARAHEEAPFFNYNVKVF